MFDVTILYHKSSNNLTEAKVNCFGLALCVVAGCQVLGYTDVHLAMSEDHAWVVYGPKGMYYISHRIYVDARF